MSEAYQVLFDGTCPNCTGDNIEFVEEVSVQGSRGRHGLRQRWRCNDCYRTFTLTQRLADVAELESDGAKKATEDGQDSGTYLYDLQRRRDGAKKATEDGQD